jgi:hypothetical protein
MGDVTPYQGQPIMLNRKKLLKGRKLAPAPAEKSAYAALPKGHC